MIKNGIRKIFEHKINKNVTLKTGIFLKVFMNNKFANFLLLELCQQRENVVSESNETSSVS